LLSRPEAQPENTVATHSGSLPVLRKFNSKTQRGDVSSVTGTLRVPVTLSI